MTVGNYILAVDPSNTRHAWALMRLHPGAWTPQIISHGRDLLSDPAACCGAYADVSCVVIEMIASYGMSVGAHVFDTCVEIGRLMRMFETQDIDVYRLTRNAVKMSVCKSAKATDANIRAAIIDRFGGPSAIKKGGPLHGVAGDTWAAIAVGLAAFDPAVEFYVPIADKEMLS